MEPTDLDDFHPDNLYRQQPVFADLRDLRNRLLDPATSSAALAEVLESGHGAAAEEAFSESADAASGPDSGDNMFERLLGERRAQPSPVATASSNLDSLLDKGCRTTCCA